MSLITQKTPLESDLAAKDVRVLQCAEATHHLAAVMRNAHEWLWKLPTARLLAILNADVAVTLATFAQNTALGLAANAALDALSLPDFPTRAPVEMGRSDITFGGTAFVFVPPPQEHSTAPVPLAEPPAD
jgi:hypothetical protein